MPSDRRVVRTHLMASIGPILRWRRALWARANESPERLGYAGWTLQSQSNAAPRAGRSAAAHGRGRAVHQGIGDQEVTQFSQVLNRRRMECPLCTVGRG